MTEHETALRQRLAIPDDAERVIVFAESSHWDPDWLLTSEEYYRRFVARNLDQAIEALLREPRRVYSVECMFFLRLYWERRPEQRDTLRQLVNAGRLRLSGSGVTTADTLLPAAEAILRDWLAGQEWLRANGMTQEPRLAYFTDSFGCSPALPSLLRAAGFDRTAITRVDGMYFLGADLELPGRFPRPGSSAALLLQQERTLDFVWRDMNGAEVLCHWNGFGYGQGDMLAYRGISRVYLARFAIADRSEGFVARRIAEYVRQLAPYARTPYLFCPIGFDFVEPIPDLTGLLERYNRVRYPVTGVWAVNAGLDDYLALVEAHRERLPTLQLDPNPYWTGFYTSRPALKRRCRALVERLLLAERLALAADGPAQAELQQLWWDAAVTNHHDFITGTSPDAVAEGEQWPWVERALARADALIRRLRARASRGAHETPHGPATASAGAAAPSGLATGQDAGLGSPLAGADPFALEAADAFQPDAPDPFSRHPTDPFALEAGDTVHVPTPAGAWALLPGWERRGDILRVWTQYYVMDMSERQGGAIVGVWSAREAPALGRGEPLLAAASNDLVGYRDSGGLWRMGHEYRGGMLRAGTRASERGAALRVRETPDGLEVVCDAELDGEAVQRTLRLRRDSPLICGRIQGRAAQGHAVCLSFETGLALAHIRTAQPGGVATRPLEKLYRPTFWPVQGFAHLQSREGGRGVAILLDGPCAIAATPGGRVELLALRNAVRERLYGIVPVPAHPASGQERVPCSFDYALLLTPAGDWRANALGLLAETRCETGGGEDSAQGESAAALVSVQTRGGSRADVAVLAVKRAWRGEGVIVRLGSASVATEELEVGMEGRAVRAAWLCDARERDLAPLTVEGGGAVLTMPGSIASVRLMLDKDAFMDIRGP